MRMLLLLLATLFLNTQPAQATALDSGYLLGPGDMIEVAVLGQADFTTRGRIRADGQFALPYLHDVTAQGETPTSLANSITDKLKTGGFYANPVVTVEVNTYASRTVTVLGEVGVPGLQPIDRPYHLSEIIARVGGIRESGADYVLIRHEGAAERRIAYNSFGRGGAADDPLIQPDDKIYVPPAPTFSIYGMVNAAGTYPMRGVMTLRKAIVRAGGLKEGGSEHHIKLMRDGERINAALDEEIEEDDIIKVGESLF